MTQRRITDNLENLLEVLPPHISHAIEAANNSDKLIEIVMDLGRLPMARFVDGELPLSHHEVLREEIDYVVERIGDFDADNRAGLERTLHRISAIRNRRSAIVGLTCRVGRAVYGTIDILQDLIDSGKSLLILGQPGIGKTTILREAARTLAETKRVVIVDTSNEIGGDGDVPHPAVGKARRMQVAQPSLQHEVMIEAVENHNPEVIVIDEIGRELEAAAARTIAERGVQLIGTAHGRTLENLLMNPTLSDLIGGIEAVTLSDEEARRRGTQKTVLERRSPPTFDVLIEIKERDYLVIHPDVADAVDTLVRGFEPQIEIRRRDEHGKIVIEKSSAPVMESFQNGGQRRPIAPAGKREKAPAVAQSRSENIEFVRESRERFEEASQPPIPAQPMRVFAYGVARNRIQQAARRLNVPIMLVKDFGDADVLITLRTYYRNRQRTILDAEARGMPIYVLRANTVAQMEQALAEIFNLQVDRSEADWEQVANSTASAIEAVLNGQRFIDLPPATAAIRRLQHEMARQANLVSHSYGKEPRRRVRIYRE
ncbi:ATPase AAA [Ornatilinea apprima]|uniref:ATPase AAA n=1 Tax=Ornatilinea apprima TaxID=1134406 RepID=A0A0P6XMM8_9CHLR|nr:R3H domain-containing nucleic acid-binding protein [Ornatilinea apprima]KPL77656.1 ATPase AAA [Ornatilinea apprima]